MVTDQLEIPTPPVVEKTVKKAPSKTVLSVQDEESATQLPAADESVADDNSAGRTLEPEERDDKPQQSSVGELVEKVVNSVVEKTVGQEATKEEESSAADDDKVAVLAVQDSTSSDPEPSESESESKQVEVVALLDTTSLSPSPSPPITVPGYDPRYNRNYEIEVLYYEPDAYLITNKPWDLRIDGDTASCPTSESLLYAHFQQHKKLYLIHQLDYVTSGVHCWGLSKRAASVAGKLFVRRQVKKTYSALVKGHLQEDNFTINKPLRDDPAVEKRVIVAEDANLGKASETEVQVLKRGYFLNHPVTHVKLTPHTGRRHQLRVHLASVGHPIIGDPTYEEPHTEEAFRTMLHSWTLELPLPGREPLRFEAAEPFGELVRDEAGAWEDIPKRMPLLVEPTPPSNKGSIKENTGVADVEQSATVESAKAPEYFPLEHEVEPVGADFKAPPVEVSTKAEAAPADESSEVTVADATTTEHLKAPEYSLEGEVTAVESDYEDDSEEEDTKKAPLQVPGTGDVEVGDHVVTEVPTAAPEYIPIEEEVLPVRADFKTAPVEMPVEVQASPADDDTKAPTAAPEYFPIEDEVQPVCADFKAAPVEMPVEVQATPADESTEVTVEDAAATEHTDTPEYTLEGQVAAVESDYETDAEEETTKEGCLETVGADDVEAGGYDGAKALTEVPEYSIDAEVEPVESDFGAVDSAAKAVTETGKVDVVADDVEMDAQRTVDDHLQLSYQYEAKWKAALEDAGQAAESVEKAVDSKDDEQDSSTKNSQEAQQTVNEHLQLSYDLEAEWAKSLQDNVTVLPQDHDEASNDVAPSPTNTVIPAKRSSDDVFQEAVIPAKRAADEAIPVSAEQTPSKKANLETADETPVSHDEIPVSQEAPVSQDPEEGKAGSGSSAKRSLDEVFQEKVVPAKRGADDRVLIDAGLIPSKKANLMPEDEAESGAEGAGEAGLSLEQIEAEMEDRPVVESETSVTEAARADDAEENAETEEVELSEEQVEAEMEVGESVEIDEPGTVPAHAVESLEHEEPAQEELTQDQVEAELEVNENVEVAEPGTVPGHAVESAESEAQEQEELTEEQVEAEMEVGENVEIDEPGAVPGHAVDEAPSETAVEGADLTEEQVEAEMEENETVEVDGARNVPKSVADVAATPDYSVLEELTEERVEAEMEENETVDAQVTEKPHSETPTADAVVTQADIQQHEDQVRAEVEPESQKVEYAEIVASAPAILDQLEAANAESELASADLVNTTESETPAAKRESTVVIVADAVLEQSGGPVEDQVPTVEGEPKLAEDLEEVIENSAAVPAGETIVETALVTDTTKEIAATHQNADNIPEPKDKADISEHVIPPTELKADNVDKQVEVVQAVAETPTHAPTEVTVVDEIAAKVDAELEAATREVDNAEADTRKGDEEVPAPAGKCTLL